MQVASVVIDNAITIAPLSKITWGKPLGWKPWPLSRANHGKNIMLFSASDLNFLMPNTMYREYDSYVRFLSFIRSLA